MNPYMDFKESTKIFESLLSVGDLIKMGSSVGKVVSYSINRVRSEMLDPLSTTEYEWVSDVQFSHVGAPNSYSRVAIRWYVTAFKNKDWKNLSIIRRKNLEVFN